MEILAYARGRTDAFDRHLVRAATPATRALARRLVALASERTADSPAPAEASVQVCEALRRPLTRLAGAGGYRYLLTRAVALATAEVPRLEGLSVLPDGSLAGVEHLEGSEPLDRPEPLEPGGVVLVAELLGLLIAFIGETLTRSLVREAWPDVSSTDVDQETGDRS